MKIKIFGLLHLAENEHNVPNLSVKNFKEQISIYVNNAKVLSRSLLNIGIEFGLLTNNKTIVEECALVNNDDFSLMITEIPFITKVPSGTRFYSAHHKIDALRYMASLKDVYCAICDLDMVCIKDFPSCLHNIIKLRIPLYYDISDQVIPAYGHEVIIRDLSTLSGLASEGRWSGGEFISGTPEFFNKLIVEIDSIYDNYVANIPYLHHVGDEAIISAAFEKIKRQGVYVADAGTLFIVGRYWSANVLHPQKPFAYFKNCFLLHLPADKKFISNFYKMESKTSADFISIYEKKIFSFSSKFKNWIELLARFIKKSVSFSSERLKHHR